MAEAGSDPYVDLSGETTARSGRQQPKLNGRYCILPRHQLPLLDTIDNLYSLIDEGRVLFSRDAGFTKRAVSLGFIVVQGVDVALPGNVPNRHVVKKGGRAVVESGDDVGRMVRKVNRHHPWSMYLGGPAKQALVDLPETLHKTYHKGLDELLPRWRSAKHYRELSPIEQARNFERFRKYTERFDKRHGTQLWEAVVNIAAAAD